MSYKSKILETDAGGTGVASTSIFPTSGTVAITTQLGLSTLQNTPELFVDFMFSTSPYGGFISSVSGGSIAFTNGISGHPGIAQLSTGAGATNRSELVPSTSILPILLGSGEVIISWIIRIPVLSSVTERFLAFAGLNGSIGGAVSNGVGISYTDNVNSGNWTIIANNGASTSADSGIAVVAGTWYCLTATVNAAATSVSFTINGVSAGTVAANIPTATATGPATFIKKSVGTTATVIDVDAVYMKYTLTTPRFL